MLLEDGEKETYHEYIPGTLFHLFLFYFIIRNYRLSHKSFSYPLVNWFYNYDDYYYGRLPMLLLARTTKSSRERN